MKIVFKVLTILIVVIFIIHRTKKKTKQVIYNEMFNWQIEIPYHFDSVDPEKWLNPHDHDLSYTSTEKSISDSTLHILLLKFEENKDNYFEAISSKVESEEKYNADRNYMRRLYGIAVSREDPAVEVDTLTSTELIGDLEFYKFAINLKYPDHSEFNNIMYSKIFGDKALEVNIQYDNKVDGRRILNAWKNSSFSNLSSDNKDREL